MMHLGIAPIVLPALMAALCLFLPQFARGLTAITLIGLLALHLAPLPEVYFLGSWPAPFGIVLVMDRLSSLMLILVAGLSAVVMIYASVNGWDQRGRHFYPLFLLQIMGLNGAFLTADAFNLFVFFEVLLIASYGLMVHGGMRAAMSAGVHYVAFNLLGSAVFLLALGLIYNLTGTLNMADIGQKLALLPAQDAGLIRIAAVLFLAVFAIKGGLVPLHFWVTRSYSATSAPVAALFAVMTKVGAYAVIRFGLLIFPVSLTSIGTLWADVIYGSAIATILVGGLGAMAARSLPHLVSYAAIGSMGVVFLAISTFTPAGLSAALYYILHSTLATALLFLLAEGRSRALFLAGAIAMVGLPPLSGFVGKVLILQAVPDPLAWAAVLLGSLLTLIGFAKIGSDLYWKSEAAVSEAKLWPIGILLAAILALTVFASPVMDYLSDARMFDLPAYIAVQNLGGM